MLSIPNPDLALRGNLSDWLGLLAFADRLEEDGRADSAGDYRNLAWAVHDLPGLGKQMMKWRTVGQLVAQLPITGPLADSFYGYASAVGTAQDDPQGRFGNGRYLLWLTPRERAAMRRRTRPPSFRRQPNDSLTCTVGSRLTWLMGQQDNRFRPCWSLALTVHTRPTLWVDARLAGFLLARLPLATWHLAGFDDIAGPVVLAEGGVVRALLMPLMF